MLLFCNIIFFIEILSPVLSTTLRTEARTHSRTHTQAQRIIEEKNERAQRISNSLYVMTTEVIKENRRRCHQNSLYNGGWYI